MFPMRQFFLISSLSLCLSMALQIDNEVIGNPVVECGDSMTSLTFSTKKPFNGRVYVHGMAGDEKCARSFTQNTDQHKFAMMVQNGDCNMQRQRVSGTLEGIMFSVTIVVSFHSTFVTKADRAFRCMCFFRSIRRLTSAIDISPLGTTELLESAKMPSCTYAIKSGGMEGPSFQYGKVGDKIFHVWHCDNPEQGFLVHSCWVGDGKGSHFDLIDIDGCAIDPIIQPDVKYDLEKNMAMVETSGYKFSDTNLLNYQCVIELCKKGHGECDGLSPPACGHGHGGAASGFYRKKRSDIEKSMVISARHIRDPTQMLSEKEMDLVASVNIIDATPEATAADPETQIFIDSLNEPVQRIGTVNTNRICIPSPFFALILTTAVLFFMLTTMITIGMVMRTRAAFKNDLQC